jgi:hypothetical protein
VKNMARRSLKAKDFGLVNWFVIFSVKCRIYPCQISKLSQRCYSVIQIRLIVRAQFVIFSSYFNPNM